MQGEMVCAETVPWERMKLRARNLRGVLDECPLELGIPISG